MQLSDLIAALEAIAPTRHAESWDNVGLLAGDPEQSVGAALLTTHKEKAELYQEQFQSKGLTVTIEPADEG